MIYIIQLKKCTLCGAEIELKLNYIVPKMAIRYLKKSAIESIQNSKNPYMLCSKCEDLCSENEMWFADKYSHPYLNKEKTIFDYDDNLFFFITSVSWRSLYLDITDFAENSIVGMEALECLISSEKIMSVFLQAKRADLGTIENHILFMDIIKEFHIGKSDSSEWKSNAIFHRGIRSYTFCDEKEKTYATLTDMLGIILITIYHKDDNDIWEGTKVVNGMGQIEVNKQTIESVVVNELVEILRTIGKAKSMRVTPHHDSW